MLRVAVYAKTSFILLITNIYISNQTIAFANYLLSVYQNILQSVIDYKRLSRKINLLISVFNYSIHALSSSRDRAYYVDYENRGAQSGN